MKKVLLIVLLLLLLGTFLLRNQIQAASYSYLYYSPCDTPISYSIGVIDPEFNLTKEEVLKRAITAESIWEQAYNKNLFQYDSSSPFTINATYDERQGLRSEANTLRSELEEKQGSIDSRIDAFNKKSAKFKSDVDSLNQDIAYWNAQGGAPKDEYEALNNRQEDLRQQSEELKNEAGELNASTDSFNSLVKDLNQTVNTFNQALEEKPEGGIYMQHGDSKNITVFFNNSEDEFVYTLAHEMGHALGIDHVTDPRSIMYAKVNTVLTPSSFDLAELEKSCKKVSFTTPLINKLKTLRLRFL